ncbi:MAG: hypothetical protein U0174_03470 [Polyangiaceae bacterium]
MTTTPSSRLLSSFFSLALVTLAAACSSGGTTGTSSGAPTDDDGGTTADGGVTLSDSAASTDGALALNGSFTFTVDGKSFTANRIIATVQTDRITITGAQYESDGIFYDAVSVTFSKTASGKDKCGSIIGLPERTVTYGRYFRTNGQTATEKQYLSGIEPARTCDFTVSGHAPESGNASGALSSEKVLTSGGSVPPPVTFTANWAGVVLE